MPIRLTGMSSGLDTEALVSELVSAYRKKSEKYTKAQTKLSWKQDAWKTMNSKIYGFYTGMSDMRFSSAYKLKNTAVSDSTKARITASANAINGTQSLHITSVAKSGYLTGGQLSTLSGDKATNETKLSQLGFTGDEAKIKLNGKEITFTKDTTIREAVDKLKANGVNASFDDANQRLFVSAKESGVSNDFSLVGDGKNGTDALKVLGLSVGSKTNDAYAQKMATYSGQTASMLEKYNENLGLKNDAATALSNLTKAVNYKSAKKTVEDTEAKLTTDEAKELAKDSKAFVSVDGNGKETIYRVVGKDADGKDVYAADGDDSYTKDDDGVITSGGLYLNEYTDDVDGEEKKTYALGAKNAEKDDPANVGVQTSTEYLKEKYDVDGAEAAGYKSAVDTVDKFDEEVAAETKALTGAASDYTLAKLKDAVDNGEELDASASRTTLETQRDTAAGFLNSNKELADFAARYANATSDDERAAIATELQDKIDYLNSDDAKDYSSGAVRVNGEDATIYLNGAKFTSNSNSFTINGLTIDALSTTMSQEDYDNYVATHDGKEPDGAVSITTTTDTQGIYDKIKDFLSNYNSLINEMTSKYNAGSAKGYEPLTDDERDEMSDSEIEKWESKIKDSLFRRDDKLNGVLSAMTQAMSKQFEVGGEKLTLASFGIQTLGYGTAAVNEHNAYHIYGDKDDDDVSSKNDKLMKMITEEPDKVMEFFQQLSTDLYSAMASKMGASSLSSVNTVYNDKEMGKEYSSYNTTIKKWEEKVKDIEDKYYKQFSKMEKAMTELQGKTQQLSGLMG